MKQILNIVIFLGLMGGSASPGAGQPLLPERINSSGCGAGVRCADEYAACNGSGDDQMGIQKALDDAAGSTLVFPSGHTCVNKGAFAWTVHANTHLKWEDATARTVLGGGGANAALFAVSGDDVYFDNPQMFDSRTFNYKMLSYGILSKGSRKGLTVKGGLCGGLSYACVGIQGGNQRVTIDGLTCRGVGSWNDGARHYEGRCVDILASSAPNVDITIKNLMVSHMGKHGISSASFGAAYAIERGMISNNVISLSGDTGILCSDCEEVTIAENTATKGGQNGIDHLGQGIAVCGHPSTPSKNVTIRGNVMNDNGETGLNIGPWVKSLDADNNTALRNVVGGVKVGGDGVSDITVSNTTAAFNRWDGFTSIAAMTGRPDGVCTAGSATFTSASGKFNLHESGSDIQLPGCGPKGSVLFATIIKIRNATSVTLDKTAGTSTTRVAYRYGFFPNRVSFTNDISHDNDGSGVNCEGTIDCKISGGKAYNNGKKFRFRAGVVCQQSLRCRVAAVDAFDNEERSGTQAYGVRFYGTDQSSADQISGFGNIKALLALTDGGSSNSSSTGTNAPRQTTNGATKN